MKPKGTAYHWNNLNAQVGLDGDQFVNQPLRLQISLNNSEIYQKSESTIITPIVISKISALKYWLFLCFPFWNKFFFLKFGAEISKYK